MGPTFGPWVVGSPTYKTAAHDDGDADDNHDNDNHDDGDDDNDDIVT